MIETRREPQPAADPDYVPYDRRKLSYATTFPNPARANAIRSIEWLTGKARLLRLIRQIERSGVRRGQDFWPHALGHMGIRLATPAAEIARIPASGPLVVVANHPHGLVDGIILAELVGRVRTDYKILTRSLLTGVPAIAEFMIPVPFPHEADAQERFLRMRRQAMRHLAAGGAVVVFPAGAVAASRTPFGRAVEGEWAPFTAKMIHRSGAEVLPVYFPGQNSRAYQVANLLSPTLRQGLLLHEVVHALGRPQSPFVGKPIDRAEIALRAPAPRAFMGWLRAQTLALGQRVGTGVSPR